MDTEEQAQPSPLLELGELIQSGTVQEIKSLTDVLRPEDLADVLEVSPPAHRNVLWDLCDPDQQSEILQHIDEDLTPEERRQKAPTAYVPEYRSELIGRRPGRPTRKGRRRPA